MAEYDGEITLSVNLDTKEVTQKAKQLSSTLSDMFEGKGIDKSSKSFQSWQIQVDKALTKSRELTQQLNTLENQKIPTEQYTVLQKQIEKAETALEKLYTRREAYEELGKQAPQRLVNQITAAEEQLSRLENGMQQLVDTGKAFTLGKDTAEFENISNQLNGVNNQMVLLQTRAENMVPPEPQQRIDILKSTLHNTVRLVQLMAKGFQNVLIGVKNIVKSVSLGLVNGIKKVNSLLRSHNSGLGKMDLNWSKLLTKILQYGFGIRSLYFLFNKLRRAVTDGFNALVQFNDGVNDANKAMSRLYSSAMQLRNSLGSMVAPIVEAVAPALDLLINKLTEATTAIGMFFAKLIGKNTFIKAKKLTLDYAQSLDKSAKSKEKDTKATNQQLASYDKLNNVTQKNDTDSTEENPLDPNKMFEEVTIPDSFNDWIDKLKQWWADADFTELGTILGTKLKEALDNIPWDEIQETAYKVGKSLATLINGFVEVEGLGYTIGKSIGEAINTGIIGVNAFLDNTHWDSVGKFIGDGINGMIDTIRWEELGHLFAAYYNAIFEVIGSTAETIDWDKLGLSLSDALTKFIKDINWERIGTSLGTALQGVFTAIDTTIANVPWDELGSGVGTSINKLFTSWNPNTVGKTLGDSLTGVIDIANGFLKTTDWSKIGTWFAQGINSLVTSVDWTKLGEDIVLYVNAIFDTLTAFVQELDLAAVGQGIADALNKAVEEIDVDEIFKFLSESIITVLDGLTVTVEETDWSQLSVKFFDFIMGAFKDVDWEKITEKVSELIGAAIGGLAMYTLVWGSILVVIIQKMFNEIKQDFYDSAFKNGKFTIKGFLAGMEKAFQKIGDWIGEHILLPFIDGFKKCFQINSPSKVMEELGGFLIDGLLNAFDRFTEVLDKIIEFKDDVIEKFNNLQDEAQQFFTNIGDNIIQFKDDIMNKFEEMSSDVQRVFEDLVDPVVTAWESMGDGIRDAINYILDGIEDFANYGIDGINGFIDNLNSVGFDLPDGEHIGFDIPTLSGVSIPRLAEGAVLPPNKPFLAMLGDQKNGTNVEAPLDTIVQAMVQALAESGIGSNNQDVVVQIDGREIARATRRENQIFKQSTGYSMFEY